jgi:hypothetical protein
LQSTPPPSPTLLSAQEAGERLREIVEGFFFRNNDDQGQPPARHLLVRSPPGLGKTKEAMEWATRYRTEQAAKTSILDLYRDDITGGGIRSPGRHLRSPPRAGTRGKGGDIAAIISTK